MAVLGDVPAGLPRLAIPAVDHAQVYALVPLRDRDRLVVMMQTAATTRSFPAARRAAGRRSRLHRRRRRQRAGRPVRRFSGQCQPAAHRHRGGERRRARSWRGCRRSRSSWRCWPSARRCWPTCPKPRWPACCCSWRSASFGCRPSWRSIGARPASSCSSWPPWRPSSCCRSRPESPSASFFRCCTASSSSPAPAPIEFMRVPGTTVWWPPDATVQGEKEAGVLVMGFQAPLSFLNAYDFRRGILDAMAQCGRDVRLVVLEAGSIAAIDYTAADVLSDVIRKCRAGGVDFAVARLESVRAQEAFQRFGLVDLLGADQSSTASRRRSGRWAGTTKERDSVPATLGAILLLLLKKPRGRAGNVNALFRPRGTRLARAMMSSMENREGRKGAIKRLRPTLGCTRPAADIGAIRNPLVNPCRQRVTGLIHDADATTSQGACQRRGRWHLCTSPARLFRNIYPPLAMPPAWWAGHGLTSA